MDEPFKRYKVKAPDHKAFERAKAVAQQNAHIVVENERRLTLSIDGVSPSVIVRLRECGAIVSEEFRYDLDVTPSSSANNC